MEFEGQYSEEEVEQILRRAAENQSKYPTENDKVSRDRLLSMAGEMGLTAAQVAEAEAQLAAAKTLQKDREDYQAFQKRSIGNSLVGFGVFGAIFAFFWYAVPGSQYGLIYIAAAWTLHLCHTIWKLLFSSPSAREAAFLNWRKRRVYPGSRYDMVAVIASQGSKGRQEAIVQLQTIARIDTRDAEMAVDNYLTLNPNAFK